MAAMEMLSNGKMLEIIFKMLEITFKEKDSWEEEHQGVFQVIWPGHLSLLSTRDLKKQQQLGKQTSGAPC